MNSRTYEEDDLLPLSGIQHFAYCKRQWGLIHVERQWIENLSTAEGRILHQRVDDPYFIESRGHVKTVRSIPLLSKTLGLYGVADLIELYRSTSNDCETQYSIVEYKRGKPKPEDWDEVQLCAQAICLEEMLGVSLDFGYMYYGETKRRHRVDFNESLRERVKTLAEEMHLLYEKGKTPAAEKSKRCKNCSVKEICLPKLSQLGKKIEAYMADLFNEMEE
ncbi:MAG: CRISPR-associated protein Cas4 [Dethiobacteria bacterium]|jgi:CRISPR-associated exonuclease Cas4|nr:CRISPR-associated protein Cas4 [Bacillota bacterium]